MGFVFVECRCLMKVRILLFGSRGFLDDPGIHLSPLRQNPFAHPARIAGQKSAVCVRERNPDRCDNDAAFGA